MYTPPLILFPFAAPLIKLLAHNFPDEGLARVRAGRQVVIDIVKQLMDDRRQEIAYEQVPKPERELLIVRAVQIVPSSGSLLRLVCMLAIQW